MHDEEPPHFARYFSYLNLFVFFMLLLVLGANYVILFIDGKEWALLFTC